MDRWTVDVARIEGEDEDVGLWTDVDSRITSLWGWERQRAGAQAGAGAGQERGRGVGIGVVRVGDIPLPT